MIKIGDKVKVNIGDSAYFGSGKRNWVPGTVSYVHTRGNARRYDVTLDSGGTEYSAHSMDIKKVS